MADSRTLAVSAMVSSRRSSGLFGETTADGVFISRFENDLLVYSQNKFGWTLLPLRTQLLWNWNLTTDVRRFAWANTTEQGPGIRFRLPGLPKSMLFSANALQGNYTVMKDNPRPKRYYDLRIGLWYAFSSLACCSSPASRRRRCLLLTDEPGAWPAIFDSVGLSVRQASDIPSAVAIEQIKSGAFGIVEGASAAAESLGIKPGTKRVVVRSVVDDRAPKLGIIWEKAQELPVFELPADAQVFAKERWTGAPLMAGFRRGKGAVLWLATKPGVRGYERFPYVLAGAGRSRPATAVAIQPTLGLLRFFLPDARRRRLLRRTLAQGRYRRAPRRRVALQRTRPGAR